MNNVMVSIMGLGTFFLVVFSGDLCNSEVEVNQHLSYGIYMNSDVNRINLSFTEHQRTCKLSHHKPRNHKKTQVVEVTETKL